VSIFRASAEMGTGLAEGSQPASGGGVVLEEAAATDVLADLFKRAVPGVLHDGALGGAAFSRRSSEARAQRVSGEGSGRKSHPHGQAFDDFGELVIADGFNCHFPAPTGRWP